VIDDRELAVLLAAAFNAGRRSAVPSEFAKALREWKPPKGNGGRPRKAEPSQAVADVLWLRGKYPHLGLAEACRFVVLAMGGKRHSTLMQHARESKLTDRQRKNVVALKRAVQRHRENTAT
jgi:hypothetical protein